MSASPARETFLLSRRAFLVLLATSYLAAFASYWWQVQGLIGSAGILPVGEYLDEVRPFLGRIEACRLLPTLCWISSSDAMLHALCAIGVVAAALLLAGVAPRVCLIVLWIAYLSLMVAGQDFLGYQWDALLLETGLLAVFVAPRGLWPGARWQEPPSRVYWGLVRWLLLRFMLLSGLVKLASGDQTWRSLAALSYHYWTQPIPSWIGWYVWQLPDAVHRASVVVMFSIELGLPFFVLARRGLRLVAAAGFAGLQLVIDLTGNYGFFGLLTCALCITLVDDRALQAILQAILPARLRHRVLPERTELAHVLPLWTHTPGMVLAAVLFGSSIVISVRELVRIELPEALEAVVEQVQALRAANSYGLFARMTTTRPELEIQGSQDGKSWEPYRFRWKAGPLDRAPPFLGPHMPRLDWQMWFEALHVAGHARPSAWFLAFEKRLLQGSPAVLALLERKPFARPPRYVRAVAFDYRFSALRERRQNGAWWDRDAIGTYLPAVMLEDGELVLAHL